jgi:hypothetical protein
MILRVKVKSLRMSLACLLVKKFLHRLDIISVSTNIPIEGVVVSPHILFNNILETFLGLNLPALIGFAQPSAFGGLFYLL